MKLRRRIAFSKAQDCADFRLQRCDYSRDLRPVEWVPIVILRGNNSQDGMSALGQKRTFGKVGLMLADIRIARCYALTACSCLRGERYQSTAATSRSAGTSPTK